MTDALHIAPYDPADYAAVTDLWRNNGIALYPPDEEAYLARTAAQNAGLFLVARDGDRVVGAVLGTSDGRALWVQHLAVDAAYRRHGLGTRLLDLLQAEGLARELMVMMLLVYRDNEAAIRFYERQQWFAVPQAQLMVKPIGRAADEQSTAGDRSPDEER